MIRLLAWLPLAVWAAAIMPGLPAWIPFMPWVLLAVVLARGTGTMAPLTILLWGVVVDGVDPASSYFFTFVGLLGGLLCHGVGLWIVPGRARAVAYALTLTGFTAVTDRLLSTAGGGGIGFSWHLSALAVVLSGPMAAVVDWLWHGVPGSWRPWPPAVTEETASP